MHCVVPRLSGTPGAIRLPAPALGEHNDEILSAAGFPPGRIAALRACGALVDPAART
jgi:formyl-CoA transferase